MDIYKSQAKRLRACLNKLGINVNHCQSLELIANVHGARNWQTLRVRDPFLNTELTDMLESTDSPFDGWAYMVELMAEGN